MRVYKEEEERKTEKWMEEEMEVSSYKEVKQLTIDREQ